MALPDFNPGGGSTSGPSRSEIEERRRPISGYASDTSAYAPNGDPGQWGYTGGSAWSSYVAENPWTRSNAGGGFRYYRSGDLTAILRRQVNQGTIVDLQLALVTAGLLDEDDIAFGYIDTSTEDAFSTILGVANQNGLAWQDVLSQAAAGGMNLGGVGPGGSGGGAQVGPTIIQLPNRDDLLAAQEDTFFAKTGQRVDPDLVETAVDAVLDTLRTQQERQVQREMDAQGAGIMFTEGAPDVGRLLEEEVEERRPGLVMSKGVRNAMDEWFSAIQGPV